MSRFLALVLFPLLCAVAVAQSPRPADEVDNLEILRRGDRVTITGEGPRDDGDALFAMAMAPPADDHDRWNISLWGKSTDPKLLGLVRAFERDPNLSAFIAAPPEPNRTAWAHFHVFHTDDQTQRPRLKQFEIAVDSAPVLILQPPRDGSFGGITKVKGPRGDEVRCVVIDRIDLSEVESPAALRRRITKSVELWCAKLKASGFTPPAKLSARYEIDARERRLAASASHGQSPATFPWGPNAPPPATPVNPIWPAGGPVSDPIPLTVAQIRAAVPEATTEFVLEQLEAKAADINALAIAWLKRKPKEVEKAPATVAVATPATTPTASGPSLLTIFGLVASGNLMVGIPVLIGWIVTRVRSQRVAAGQPMLLTETQYKALSDLSDGLSASDLQNLGSVALELLKKKVAPAS